MKKTALLSLFAFIFLISACGSPAPTATQLPTVPTATEAPAQPAAATESVPAAGKSTQVDVTLADNTINSSLATFQAGVPYTFVITNTGRHGHNFNINTPVSVAGGLDAALSSALLVVPREKLAVGSSVTVEYTFPDTAVGAQLEFSCLIQRHYEDGMVLAITVTK